MVRIWKGIAKPIALAGFALAALAGFFHYTRIGPNEVSIDDELDAQDEVTRIRAREADRKRAGESDTGLDEERRNV
jgi:formate dehydrogenase iron-sulfur subunit